MLLLQPIRGQSPRSTIVVFSVSDIVTFVQNCLFLLIPAVIYLCFLSSF